MADPDPRSIECESKEPLIKCRYIVILMGFAAQFLFHVHENAMNVGIVAMINNSAVASQQEEITSNSCSHVIDNVSQEESIFSRTSERDNGEFLWDTSLRSYIIGSRFLCFVISIVPAGRTTSSVGCKKMLFWTTFFPSVLTFITPLAAWCGVYVVIFVQCLRGIAQAGIIPAQSVLVANWCPREERGFSYTVILTGAAWGTILGSHVAGLLSQLGGWPSVFYVIGGAGIIVSLFIGYFMHDNPRAHPNISKEEFRCIISSQENDLTQKRPGTPWGKLLSSVPFYALAFAYFGQLWALSHFLTVQPVYLKTVLRHSTKQNGLFSTLAFLLQIMTSLSAGWLSLHFIRKNTMNVDKARKFWNSMSCLGYSVCLLGIYFAGCNRSAVIVFFVLSFASTGLAYAGCWITSTDMTPIFAGLVNSIAYLFGVTSEFILPAIVSYLTNGMQTVEQWNKILFVSFGVILASGAVFAIFGSADIQPWNSSEPKSKTPPNHKTSTAFDSNSKGKFGNNMNNVL